MSELWIFVVGLIVFSVLTYVALKRSFDALTKQRIRKLEAVIQKLSFRKLRHVWGLDRHNSYRLGEVYLNAEKHKKVYVLVGGAPQLVDLEWEEELVGCACNDLEELSWCIYFTLNGKRHNLTGFKCALPEAWEAVR